jgi:hypothetical protein
MTSTCRSPWLPWPMFPLAVIPDNLPQTIPTSPAAYVRRGRKMLRLGARVYGTSDLYDNALATGAGIA